RRALVPELPLERSVPIDELDRLAKKARDRGDERDIIIGEAGVALPLEEGERTRDRSERHAERGLRPELEDALGLEEARVVERPHDGAPSARVEHGADDRLAEAALGLGDPGLGVVAH